MARHMTLKFRCLAARKSSRFEEKEERSSRMSSLSGSPEAVEDNEGDEEDAPNDPVSTLERNNAVENLPFYH